MILDNENNARLLIVPLDLNEEPAVEARWFSRDYGAKLPSVALSWTVDAKAPLHVRWLLLPVCAGEDAGTRLAVVEHLRQAKNPGSQI